MYIIVIGTFAYNPLDDGHDIVISGLQKNVYHDFVLAALSEDGEVFNLRRKFIMGIVVFFVHSLYLVLSL